MGENTPEYKALITLTSELRLAVRSDLISLSGALLSSRLISPDNEAELRNTVHSEAERSARLVELVQNKVLLSPRHYHTFVGILHGNQRRFYDDILQKLEQTYQQEKGGESLVPDTSVNLIGQIDALEYRFRQLHGRILDELEEKRTSTTRILQCLNLLPMAIKQEYKPAVRQIFPDLRKETTVNEQFYHISPLVDFLGFGLLKYIIDQFGSNTLKVLMQSYADDTLAFMKKTTVKELMDHWPGQQEIPASFSKLRAKIDEDPATYTLFQLDQLRKRYCCEIKLTEVVFVLIGLKVANSFIVEWVIPSSLVPHLVESVRNTDFGFYLRERILKVTVDEKQLFPFLPDAKPKVPVLQAAATAVEEDVEQAITHLSSSMEKFHLSPRQKRNVERVRDQLRDCASYKGVAIELSIGFPSRVIRLSLEPTFQHIALVDDIDSCDDVKSLITAVAQYRDYPESSPPFVIAVFVRGVAGPSVGTLCTDFGLVNIVDDIIKPFLPQSAPHLMNIPKLFFISSFSMRPSQDTPLFPDDTDSNYCVAYCCAPLSQFALSSRSWFQYIIKHLLSGISVEEVVENSRPIAERYGRLHYLSCLSNKPSTEIIID